MQSRTINDLLLMKQQAQRIACLTAYDASFAALMDKAGMDIILVGDSLGMVIQGETTTVPVSLEDMIYHCRAVVRGARTPLIMADLPFMTYVSPAAAATSAARLMQEGGAHMVKLEGGRHRAETVRLLAAEGIPVCAHLGLLPQAVHQLGGFRMQGKDSASATAIIEDALTLEEAGASLVLMECVPAAVAAEVTSRLKIPTIGIGAGRDTDGQVLVVYDMLGISAAPPPTFSKNFLAEGAADIEQAMVAYVQEVRSGIFPADRHILA